MSSAGFEPAIQQATTKCERTCGGIGEKKPLLVKFMYKLIFWVNINIKININIKSKQNLKHKHNLWVRCWVTDILVRGIGLHSHHCPIKCSVYIRTNTCHGIIITISDLHLIYDIWYDMIWYDLIWYDIWFDMIWFDMIWFDMIWYGMIWYDMIWFDMIWYICQLQLG